MGDRRHYFSLSEIDLCSYSLITAKESSCESLSKHVI